MTCPRGTRKNKKNDKCEPYTKIAIIIPFRDDDTHTRSLQLEEFIKSYELADYLSMDIQSELLNRLNKYNSIDLCSFITFICQHKKNYYLDEIIEKEQNEHIFKLWSKLQELFGDKVPEYFCHRTH